jgi:ATP-dependent RNA helicase DDX49/DBP8
MIQMTTPIELVGQHVQVSLDDCLCSLAGSSTCNVFIGRHGLALSLITEFDIDRIHAIEDQRNTKMVEYEVDEDKVIEHIDVINVTKREIELRLSETSFGERRRANKQKRQLQLQAQLHSSKQKKHDLHLQARTKRKHLH